MLAVKIICLVIGSYFIGNINFAVIISRIKKRDIRTMGSGNPGAVNMIRTFGNKLGALTLFLDVVKGAVPALTGLLLLGDSAGVYIGGFSVMLGHMFPAVFRFKGGKGVATVIGIYLVANWWVSLIVFAVAVIYVIFFHYGFISSMIIVFSMSIVEIIWGTKSTLDNWGEILRLVLICVLMLSIIIAHRKNFVRLFKGTENKIYIIKKMNKEPAKPAVQEVAAAAENIEPAQTGASAAAADISGDGNSDKEEITGKDE